jgi:hypothetical protein
MNTLTQEQAMDISGEHSLDWYHYGDEIHAALNAAFALGVAQGKANQIAMYEKAERFERMLMGRL